MLAQVVAALVFRAAALRNGVSMVAEVVRGTLVVRPAVFFLCLVFLAGGLEWPVLLAVAVDAHVAVLVA